MSKILILICFALFINLILCNIRKVPDKETKSVFDIKQFLKCAENSKDFYDSKKILDVLEHKKGYQKQIAYLRRVLPHNKDITLCKKASRKTVPKMLDEEIFALENK